MTYTIYRNNGLEYGYTKGNTLGGYDLAVVIELSDTQIQVLDLIYSDRKEERQAGYKAYSNYLGE